MKDSEIIQVSLRDNGHSLQTRVPRILSRSLYECLFPPIFCYLFPSYLCSVLLYSTMVFLFRTYTVHSKWLFLSLFLSPYQVVVHFGRYPSFQSYRLWDLCDCPSLFFLRRTLRSLRDTELDPLQCTYICIHLDVSHV